MDVFLNIYVNIKDSNKTLSLALSPKQFSAFPLFKKLPLFRDSLSLLLFFLYQTFCIMKDMTLFVSHALCCVFWVKDCNYFTLITSVNFLVFLLVTTSFTLSPFFNFLDNFAENLPLLSVLAVVIFSPFT